MSQSTTQEPSMSNVVINSALGVHNVMNQKEYRKIVYGTFDLIKRVLQDHCGPSGRFAVIPDLVDRSPKFTKDGINIVKAMEFISPIEEFAKHALAFVGRRIEVTAGDGTTSGMIMAATIMKDLSEQLSHVPYTMLNYEIQKLMAEVRLNYKRTAITVDELVEERIHKSTRSETECYRDVVYAVAFIQAYVSSHGIYEVAHAVGSMMAATDRAYWDRTYFTRETYETDTDIEVFNSSDNYQGNVRVLFSKMCSDPLSMKHECSDSILYIMPHEFADGDVLTKNIFQEIENDLKQDRHVTVMAPDSLDSYMVSRFKTLTDLYPKFIMFLVNMHTDENLHDLFLVALLTGVSPFEWKRSPLMRYENISVKYASKILTLNGLYQNPNKYLLHPNLVDKTASWMPDYVEYLKQISLQLSSEDATNDTVRQRMAVDRFLMRLTNTNQCYINIGGSLHNNETLKDIIEDAILAARRSLQHGFVVGGCATLRDVVITSVTTLQDQLVNSPEPWEIVEKKKKILEGLKVAILHGIEDVHAGILKWDAENVTCQNLLQESWYVNRDRLVSDITLVQHLVMPKRPDRLVIQPAHLDPTILERVMEIAPKFACSQRVITPNGVVDPDRMEKPSLLTKLKEYLTYVFHWH